MALTLHGTVSDNTAVFDRRSTKPLIINGDMAVAQRGTSQTGQTANHFPIDRFGFQMLNFGTWTSTQSTVVPTGQGFAKSLKIDCTTADTSIAAGEALIIQYRGEGFDCQQLKATSTTTRAFTLSFYAKSNASRAIATEINLTNGTNRSASKLHTIGTSWARYTFTVPAASSTQIDNDNSSELQVNFWLHAGSTYSSGTMSASLAPITNANRAAGIGSIFASTDNEIEITGIQLEVGSQATPFEHRSFGEELGLCQRYYYQHVMGGTSGPRAQQYHANYKLYDDWFPVTMRAAPTGTVTVNNGSPTAFSTGRNRWQAYQASDYDGTTIYMMTSAVYDAEL